MEFIITRSSICFFIVTCILLEYAVTSDLQSYYIECIHDSDPTCCQVPCMWNPENSTQIRDADCKVHEKEMECFYEGRGNSYNCAIPSIPTGRVKQDASCKIRKQGQSDYKVSCHEDEKPICCDTQCKCDLNLLKFQIKEGKIECRWSVGDNPQFNTSNKACDLKIDDECYIYTDTMDPDVTAKQDTMDPDVTAKQEMNPSSCNTTVLKWICETECYILYIVFAATIIISIGIGIGIVIGIGICMSKHHFSEKKTEDMGGTNQKTTKNKKKKNYRGNGSKSERKFMATSSM